MLFLDEPFEAIDPVTAKIMRDLLQSVSRHGVTVFLTSHILSMVERIAHQIVMIRKGTKVWDSARRRTAAIARGPLFRSGGDACRGGVGMARPIAILRALVGRVPPRLDGLSIPRRQQFLPDHRFLLRQAGIFVYLIMGLVVLFPLSTDPLRKIPPSRLALWPLDRRERWILRLASPWINPLTWGLAAVADLGRGTDYFRGAVGGDRGRCSPARFCSPRVPSAGRARHVAARAAVSPARSINWCARNVREILSTLDFYCALLLSLAVLAYRIFGPAAAVRSLHGDDRTRGGRHVELRAVPVRAGWRGGSRATACCPCADGNCCSPRTQPSWR